MAIYGIMACSINKGIGKKNKLPWKLKEDLIRFKKLTKGEGNNCIIMGRNTWESIKFLKDRDHIILSNKLNIEYRQNNNIVKSFSNINDIINYIRERKYNESWVIGGEQILKQFLQLNIIDRLYLTLLNEKYDCDVFMPNIPLNYFQSKYELLNEKTESGKEVYMLIYDRIKKGMCVKYEYNIWTVEMIHFEDYPNVYFTIKDSNGNEKQTIREKLKLIL